MEDENEFGSDRLLSLINYTKSSEKPNVHNSIFYYFSKMSSNPENEPTQHRTGRKRRRVKRTGGPNDPTQSGLKQVPRGYGERKVLSEFPKVDCLTFGEVLGFGHFSHVYEGVYQGKYPAAIKIIERGSRRLVEKEIDLLTKLRDLPNIIQLYEVIDLEETTLLVFERVKSIKPEEFYATVTLPKFRYVLKCLFTALRAAHEHNIVHRDVKLGNILISPDYKTVKLIDWGCSSMVKSKLSSKAGSRTCRSLEMLLGYDGYETAGDMWAMGSFIYTVLCGGVLPWREPNSWQTIVKLASYFGRRNTLELAANLDCQVPEDVVEAIQNAVPTRLSANYDQEMKDLFDPDLIDLMHHLLTINYEVRYSAEDALCHPFFEEEEEE
ncbi:Casein kinase II subunit alpha' [Tritrichomonas foetus]|uniref:non-specific serine/threonine protein kinase n=1 Tax=Tritrichomonas foetus TaxID=1144522 RepID=A0A1J4JIH4_9EUKA|nr:Casein kinase II subunit alpha' [Tritrichomonas foetus]|eukprot:OHS98135.1 Casein kinase II subunit alpha' [Tritrichomonas foetus]